MIRAGWLALACCAAPMATQVVPADSLAWHANAGGFRAADVWGDAAHGAHGTLAQLPAGLVEAAHVHSHVFRVIVLAGTMTYSIAGEVTPALTAGSYVAIPAGTVHFAHCLADAACEVYIEQDGPFDVITR